MSYELQFMHTDQYLQWDSHHNLVAKYSVISTLTHRARTVYTRPELLKKETQHLRKALNKCKYLKWALDKVERKYINRSQENSNMGNFQGEPSEEDSNNPSDNTIGRDPTKDKYNKGHIVISYLQGLGENIKKICRKYSIQTHFKGNRTIKNIPVKLKRQGSFRQEEWEECCVLTCYCVHKWERVPLGALISFSKGPGCLFCVLFITHELPALIMTKKSQHIENAPKQNYKGTMIL